MLWEGGPECYDKLGVVGGCCGWVYQSVMRGWVLVVGVVGVPECYDRVGVRGGRCGWAD